MERKNLMVLAVVLSAIVIFSFVYFNYGQDTSPGVHDDFAKCLTGNGIAMYGTEWCDHCKDQKALFGSSFRFIDYKDCDYSGECSIAGIKLYPTWIINGIKYTGTQSLETLSELSGCSLE
jgi:glutaredoxin